MGEMSELVQDGILCEKCGAFVGEKKIRKNGGEIDGNDIVEVPGFPLTCEDCDKEKYRRKKNDLAPTKK